VKRAFQYLGISVTLAFLFAVVYVIVGTLTLPKTDQAYGQRPFEDPLVFPVMALAAAVSGLVGWPFFFFLGRHRRPGFVVVVAGITTLLFIIVATPINARVGWFGSYIVCIGALIYCNLKAPHRDKRQISDAS
jgi:uncharacterized BrkB/YihY/UPF0761 family membrane protein